MYEAQVTLQHPVCNNIQRLTVHPISTASDIAGSATACFAAGIPQTLFHNTNHKYSQTYWRQA
jgi:hypothetical protein